MLHNPETYTDPSTFNPSRFLGQNPEPDPFLYAFGYGRRRCPGVVLADISVWLTIAQSLAVFDIQNMDRKEKTVEDSEMFQCTSGFLCHPILPTEGWSIKARSKVAENLIRAVEVEHPWERSDSVMLPSGM